MIKLTTSSLVDVLRYQYQALAKQYGSVLPDDTLLIQIVIESNCESLQQQWLEAIDMLLLYSELQQTTPSDP